MSAPGEGWAPLRLLLARTGPPDDVDVGAAPAGEPLSLHPSEACPLQGTPLHMASPVFDPALPEILEARITTIWHIPNRCRREFAAMLGQLLVTVTQKPTGEAVYALFALPKLVLWNARQRSSASPKHMGADIQRRMRLFETGCYAALWAEASATAPAKGRKPSTRLDTQMQRTHDLPSCAVMPSRGSCRKELLPRLQSNL